MTQSRQVFNIYYLYMILIRVYGFLIVGEQNIRHHPLVVLAGAFVLRGRAVRGIPVDLLLRSEREKKP